MVSFLRFTDWFSKCREVYITPGNISCKT